MRLAQQVPHPQCTTVRRSTSVALTREEIAALLWIIDQNVHRTLPGVVRIVEKLKRAAGEPAD